MVVIELSWFDTVVASWILGWMVGIWRFCHQGKGDERLVQWPENEKNVKVLSPTWVGGRENTGDEKEGCERKDDSYCERGEVVQNRNMGWEKEIAEVVMEVWMWEAHEEEEEGIDDGLLVVFRVVKEVEGEEVQAEINKTVVVAGLKRGRSSSPTWF